MWRAGISAVAAALALTGCGGGDAPPARPEQPYPPKAAEPGTAPEPAEKPAGRVVEVGAKPEGVVFDQRTGLVAVGVNDPDELVLLDRDGNVRKRVPLPGPPRHLQLAGPGGPVLVPSEPANELVEVSLPGGGLRATPVGKQPHDATAGEDGRIFTADERGSTISEVRDGRRIRTVPVDTQPGGIAAVGDRVAVVAVQAYTVELYDQRTLQGQGARNAGLGPTHVVADGEGRIYVADTRGGAILVYTTEPRLKVAGRIALPGSPYGLATRRRSALGDARPSATCSSSSGPATSRSGCARSRPSASPTPSPSTPAPAGSSWPRAAMARCSSSTPDTLGP